MELGSEGVASERRPYEEEWAIQGLRRELLAGGAAQRDLPGDGGVIGRPGFDSWVGKIPGEGHGNPLQYSCLENPHGQRSLGGYSPP